MLIELNEKEYETVKKVLSMVKESEEPETPAEEGDDKIKAVVADLADRTNNDPEDADVDERGSGMLVSFGSEEYEVYESWDDAYDAACEREKDLLEDMAFQSGVRLEMIGKTWRDYMVNQDDLEELDEYIDDWSDIKQVREYVDEQHIDWEEMAKDVVDTDGVGHTLAGYDGEEIELDNGYYAYRIN